ncbi:MAG: hypothetical protein JJU37_15705 [Balneolaceae bacterium]|nr:hypothetical protein [Balneolaceae bacterium]
MTHTNIFPPYLGFGIFNSKSISENGDEIRADYHFNGQPIHRAVHLKKNDSWVIMDTINNSGRSSSGKDLEKATLMHFEHLDCNTDTTFQYVLNLVCGLGNIYFQYLKSNADAEGAASFYPSGKIVVFRVPITNETLESHITSFSADKLSLLMEINDNKKPDSVYDSFIFMIKKNGERKALSIRMIEYYVPLQLLHPTAEYLCSNQLIEPEKIFRMIIQDIPCKVDSASLTFQGTPEDDYQSYTIYFQGIDHESEFPTLMNDLRQNFLSDS